MMTTNSAHARPLPQALTRSLRASEHRALLVAGDLAAGALAVAIALWLWSIPAGAELSRDFLAARLPWFAGAALWAAVAGIPAAHPSVAFSARRTLAVLLRGAFALGLLYLAAYFYAPRGGLPRLVAIYFLWEAVLLTFAWRLVFIAVFSRERFRHRTIVVGSGRAAQAAVDLVRDHRARRSDLAAVVPDDGERQVGVESVRTVRLGELADMLAGGSVSEIILAPGRPPSGELLQALLACQEAGIELVRVQTLFEQTLRRVPVDLLEPDWLMTDLADAMRLRDASWLGKRAVDVAGSLAGLALVALLTPCIALAIRLDSPGPVLYRQPRVGRGGVPFTLVKFRTMTQDAERPGEPRWAGAGDPRVTRAGRVLRRTRLDELPQLLSVLKGDMSLVGPRPERAEFVARLQATIPFYRARLMAPPGLTGWAQVNLPYGDSDEAARAKLEYDLYYIKHRSLGFDAAIMLRTVGTVLRLRGI
jgi:exopolysaccharide biosynthesis polyprenyl glycosylphosphotransferase